MSEAKGVDSVLHENIAESGKSIADENWIVSVYFCAWQSRQIFFFCFHPTSLNTRHTAALWVGELVRSIRVFIIVLSLFEKY